MGTFFSLNINETTFFRFPYSRGLVFSIDVIHFSNWKKYINLILEKCFGKNVVIWLILYKLHTSLGKLTKAILNLLFCLTKVKQTWGIYF